MAYVPDTDPEGEADRLEDARATRVHFGLDSSSAAVANARAAGVMWGDHWYLADEIGALKDKAASLEAWKDPEELLPVEDLFDSYAGCWFDASAPQGTWFVGFTKRAEELTGILRDHSPYPDRIQPFIAKYTWSHLDDVEKAINRDYDWREAAGIRANAARIDIPRNRVLILYGTDRSDLKAKLQERYGPEIEVAIGYGVGIAWS